MPVKTKPLTTAKSKIKSALPWIGVVLGAIALMITGYILFTELNENNEDRSPQTIDDEYPKLLILGIDAANWEIIDPLIARGKMPNLEKLINEGIRTSPKTLNPTISPAIWTTAATGRVPERHGIRNFLGVAKDYDFQFIGSDSRTVKAGWNILSDAGFKVGLFSWWATWPPEDINGYTVTDLAVLKPDGAISPEELKKSMITNSIKIMGFDALTKGYEVELPSPTSPTDRNFFDTAVERVDTLTKLFIGNSLHAFDKEKPDVLFQIFGGIDAAQHLFLRFHKERIGEIEPLDPELTSAYGTYIEQLYIKQDELIGEYMKRSGPNTNIIVMSDHGVFLDPAYGFRFKRFNEVLNRLGYLEYTDGEIDFTKTIAFECNNNNFDWQRRLCINVVGKFDQGILDPSEYSSTHENIISTLKEIKTTAGEPLFHSVREATEANSDIQYDIRRDLIDEVLVINGEEIPVKQFLDLSVESGHHYSNPEGPPGIFVWKGPKIKRGARVTIDYIDILPNILYALGQPVPLDIDGRWRPELFKGTYHDDSPEYIETYETEATRLNLASVESIEESDSVLIEQRKAYIHSNISGDDTYDQHCFFLPKIEDYSIKTNLLETNPDRLVPFHPWNNPGITNQVPFDEFLPVTNIESYFPINIPLDLLSFNEEDKETYNLIVPLDILKPTYLSLWTNTSFTFNAPSEGYMRIVANGDPVDGIWPELIIKNRNETQTLTINSESYAAYDIPVQQGSVIVTYPNDALSDTEDRNVRIQRIYISDEMIDGDAPHNILRYGNDICFKNRAPGSTEIELEFIHTKEPSESSEAGARALEILQETGEIED